MYRTRKVSAVILVFLLFGLSYPLAAVSAPAETSTLPPAEDAVAASNPAIPSNGPALGVQGQVPPGEECGATMETFLKFDLSGVAVPITAATLRLRSSFASTAGTMTMRLYGSNDTSWSETAGIVWASRPTRDIDLVSTAPLTAADNDVNFTSTALATFLEGKRTSGDHKATLAVSVVACDATVTQGFDSKEATRSGFVAPSLILGIESAVSGAVNVKCKQGGYTEQATGAIDVQVSGSSYSASFPSVALSSGSFMVPIPADACLNPGDCHVMLSLLSLTNQVPSDLCGAHGDPTVYPAGNGWTYKSQPAMPFTNVVSSGRLSPANASVGPFTVVPGTTPNAVTLTGFGGANGPRGWYSVTALGVLCLMALGGGLLLRRRREARGARE